MHIALLSNHLHYPFTGFGGIERWSQHLANGFLRAGHRVTVLANAPPGRIPAHPELDPGIDIVALGRRGWLARWHGRRWLRATQPDILLSASHRFNLMAADIVGAHPATCWTASVHENLSEAAGQLSVDRQRQRRRDVSRRYNQASRVVAVSDDVAADLAANWSLDSQRITRIFNPIVDAAWYEQARAGPVHPWLQAPVEPVLVAVGRLTEQKGFDVLLDAFARVRSTRACRLLILGEGHLRSTLMAQAQALGITTQVDFAGHVDQPAATMARAALFVLPSRWEGFGNVVVEALSLGTPVVATDCRSGPAEILGRGRWGRLVAVNNAAALAEAILAALCDAPDRCELARRGGEFTVSRSVGAYVELFETLLNQPSPR